MTIEQVLAQFLYNHPLWSAVVWFLTLITIGGWRPIEIHVENNAGDNTHNS